MLLRRAERPAAAVALMLAVAAVGAIITAPSEYPVTAFLLAPLVAALVADRVTTVVAVLATIAALVVIAGSHYNGAALWFVSRSLRSRVSRSSGSPAFVDPCRTGGAAELRRRRSEQRYRSLVEATSAIVWTVTEDGRFMERQPGWERTPGSAGPSTPDHGGWRPCIRRIVSSSSPRGSSASRPARSTKPNAGSGTTTGSAPPCRQARGVPIVGDGEVREWIGTVTDVHDRMEAILRASADAQLRTAVLRSLQDGVFVTTADGAIVDVNDAWPRMFGYTREEVLGAIPPYVWWPDPVSHPHGGRDDRRDGRDHVR